jgi:O-antigen biosynthesis protein WbqP
MLTYSQKTYLFFKRGIDIFGSFIGIILLSPLLLIAAIITKTTSVGPVFFVQERAGYKERTFKIYKFRSMRIDAPNVGAEALTIKEQRDLTTNWGRFIRKTSIDEIPQLFNILKGDMSFIGPRPGLTEKGEPELAASRRSYVPSAYDVKPGLSGYSQLTLNRSSDVNLRAKNDSEYVKRLSFWFDVKLFFLSFLTVFGRNSGR